MLPLGTVREKYDVRLSPLYVLFFSQLTDRNYGRNPKPQEWEEVTIPPARAVPPRLTERPVKITELDPLAAGSFPVSHNHQSPYYTSYFLCTTH